MGKRKARKLKHKATGAPLKGAERRNRVDTDSTRRRSRLLPGTRRTNALTCVLLAIATLLLYVGDLRLGFFAVDDPQYVVDNPWIRGISLDHLGYILTTPYFANYSPLHLFSYMLDFALGGLNPAAFHWSSNIWAAIVTAWVFLVGLALTQNRIVAIVATLLFAVHPAHVEAVVWISSRKDLVAAAFALPSFLAYLQYRRLESRWWYVASLTLFVLALAGKMSVATFPAAFLAYDLFVERRSWTRSLLDKIPFVLSAGLMALAVAGAQPSMGNRPSAYALAAALLQNLWLLSGFGTYVIYRVPPNAAAGAMSQVAAGLFLIAAFATPLMLRRVAPMVTVLIYWLLFAMIPAQVLSFSHPVTDRYLFFPSVAAVILIAWGLYSVAARFRRPGFITTAIAALVLIFFWGRSTLAYVAEWRDPRSVWYGATFKSADPAVSQNLGSYYLGVIDRLGANAQPSSPAVDEARRLATMIWASDPRLPVLMSEWSAGQHGAPAETAFKADLRTLAWDAFERALMAKGSHVMPGLYYNRGLILFNRGDMEGARREFMAALDEAARESFAPVRQQITVYSHTQLALICVRQNDYRGALQWYRLAEDEQNRFGGNWVPDLSASRKRLETIVGSAPRP